MKRRRKQNRKRIKIRAADVGRIEREFKTPALRHASVQGKRSSKGAYKEDKGVPMSEVREAMHVKLSKRDAKNGITLHEILRASPWRPSNYPIIGEE